MVKVLQEFASDRQLLKLSANLKIEKAQDYYPNIGDVDFLRRNDAPWIQRFAKAGGKVVISGNTKMRSVPHERLALVREGMVVIFFENAWNNWDFFAKCSLLLHWWPTIIKKLKTAKPGSFWRIPGTWPPKGKCNLLEISNKDLRLLKIEGQKAAQPKVRASRDRKRKVQGQNDLFPEGETQNAKSEKADETGEA